MKKIFIIFIVMFILLNSVTFLHITQAANIDSANLYSTGMCGDLLKYQGRIIRVTYIEYSSEGITNPAYCLQPSKSGVGELGSYTVSTNELVKDIGLWKVIVNAYPYKTLSELGVANKYEAFTATKQAIYCYLHGNSTSDYEGIGEAGNRTLTAMKKILNNANQSKETIISNEVNIKTDDNEWTQDKLNSEYVSKTYYIKATGTINEYEISLSGTVPEGTMVVNINNEKQEEFSGSEKFKVLIPIQGLKQAGEFNIKVDTEIKTKPVFYGKAPNDSMQDYAITGFMYEDSKKELKEDYEANQTKLKVIKKDKETGLLLEGIEFALLNGEQKEIYKNLRTNEKGEIILEPILPGTYYLKETKTLNGYELYEELIKIELGFGEETIIEVTNKKEEKPKVETTKSEPKVKILPVAGM